MLLALGFLAMALGSGRDVDLIDFEQLKTYFFLGIFVVTYFVLRSVRKPEYSRNLVLTVAAFFLLLGSCYSMLVMFADILEHEGSGMYIISGVLVIGIVNGLFLCCVFLSRYRG